MTERGAWLEILSEFAIASADEPAPTYSPGAHFKSKHVTKHYTAQELPLLKRWMVPSNPFGRN